MVQGIGTVAVKLNGFLPHFAQFRVEKKSNGCFGHAFKTFSELTSLTDSLQYLFQFTVGAATVATRGTIFRGCCELGRVIRHIDVVRTYGDISYFVKGEFLDDLGRNHVPGLIAGSLFLTTSLGTCLDFARDFKLVDVAGAAKSISSVSLFGVAPFRMVSQVGLCQFCCYTATGGYLFGAIDSVMKIHAGDQSTSKLLQLAYCISSLVLQLFCLAGQTLVAAPVAVTVAGSLAMVSSGFGAWWIWQVEKEKS